MQIFLKLIFLDHISIYIFISARGPKVFFTIFSIKNIQILHYDIYSRGICSSICHVAGRGVAPATAVVVVAGATAPVSAAAIVPLCGPAGPLDPAGSRDLCPRPLDLASSRVGGWPLAAGRLRLDLFLQEVHHSLVPLRQWMHRVLAPDVKLSRDVGQDRAGINYLEAAEALCEQEVLSVLFANFEDKRERNAQKNEKPIL